MKPLITRFITTALVLLVASSTYAATLTVSASGAGQYTTLLAAYNAATSGDTILVGPGAYSQASTLSQTKRLTWIGAGWDQTFVTIGGGSITWILSGANASGSVFVGMRFHSPSYFLFSATACDSTVFDRCMLTSNSYSPLRWNNNIGRLYVKNCVLVLNGTGDNYGVISLPSSGDCWVEGSLFAYGVVNSTLPAIASVTPHSGTLTMLNNVFLSFSKIYNLISGTGTIVAYNNVFYDWGSSPTFGTYPAGSTFDYNASSGPAVPGTNGITISANPFVNYDPAGYFVIGTSNLHLDAVNGAPMIDTGVPGLLDLDASRSDFGVYGGSRPLVDNGVPAYPWVVNINLSPSIVNQGLPVSASSTARIGPQY